jgi:hypothetical protein
MTVTRTRKPITASTSLRINTVAAKEKARVATIAIACFPSSVKPPPGYTEGAGLPSMGRAALYFDLAALGYG